MSTRASELSEVLSGGSDVGFMSLDLSREVAEIDQFAVNADGRLPAQFIGIGSLEATRAFPTPAVSGIFRWRGLAKVRDPIVIPDAVDVVEKSGRKVAVNPQPREMVEQVSGSAQADMNISLGVLLISNWLPDFPPAAISWIDLPSEYASHWVVIQKFFENLACERRQFIANKRLRCGDAYWRQLVFGSSRELSSDSRSRLNVDAMRFFLCGESSKMDMLIPMRDLRHPSTAIPGYTNKPLRISRRSSFISGVLPRINLPKIGNSVVIGITVHVVYDANGINSIDIEPSQPMGVIKLSVDNNTPMAFLVYFSNYFTKSLDSRFMAERASFSVVIVQCYETFKGYHGRHDRTNSTRLQRTSAEGTK